MSSRYWATINLPTLNGIKMINLRAAALFDVYHHINLIPGLVIIKKVFISSHFLMCVAYCH